MFETKDKITSGARNIILVKRMDSILFLLALALAPGIYLALAIYARDKYDREPKKILLKAFLLGCLSIGPAGLIELYLSKLFVPPHASIVITLFHAFIIVGLTEEACKFIMIRFHAYRLPEFNEPFDGIVYAAFVGLGFATTENIFYVLNGGWGIGLVRMFTSVPAHYSFAVIMGYYMGKAKFAQKHRALYMLTGLLLASLLHGAYDFFILQQNMPVLAILTIGVLMLSLRISRKATDELHADSHFRFHVQKQMENKSTDEQ